MFHFIGYPQQQLKTRFLSYLPSIFWPVFSQILEIWLAILSKYFFTRSDFRCFAAWKEAALSEAVLEHFLYSFLMKMENIIGGVEVGWIVWQPREEELQPMRCCQKGKDLQNMSVGLTSCRS